MINDETSMDALMHTWCFYDLQVFDLIIYKCLIIRLPDYMYLYSRYIYSISNPITGQYGTTLDQMQCPILSSIAIAFVVSSFECSARIFHETNTSWWRGRRFFQFPTPVLDVETQPWPGTFG